MDFYRFSVREGKKDTAFVFPDFQNAPTNDLMIRGGKFYAIWDDLKGLWSKDEADVARLVDAELSKFFDEMPKKEDITYIPMFMRSSDSGTWDKFLKYCSGMWDTFEPLDSQITFDNQIVLREDYVSFKLKYPLYKGELQAWEKLVSTLYAPTERAKIEWAIGAVISGDSKHLQKFFVFYGPPGTGKSTVINIIEMLFGGYYKPFDAKALGASANGFATEAFADNPLVAIQHDGDLSKISDNSLLNSIVSHDMIRINVKYAAQFPMRINSMLFMGSNQPVNITDAKSGVLRRLIDIHPTGRVLPGDTYSAIMARIPMELGALAHHCLRTYEEMGERYYSDYAPLEMMGQTNDFWNFIEDNYFEFKQEDMVTHQRAWEMYQQYCEMAGVRRPMSRRELKTELGNYFEKFEAQRMVGGERFRSLFVGFKFNPRELQVDFVPGEQYTIELNEYDQRANDSHFNVVCATQPAQKANQKGLPSRKWADVDTTLGEVDPTKLHYVKVPKNHIVIDFDLTDETGAKNLDLNLEAANEWPATYTEVSQGGNGLHLHYIYEGNVEELASAYSDGIEIKSLLGDSSLRRRLTMCNAHAVSTLTGQLPKKEVKPMLDEKQVKSEKGLRELVARNLAKEIHPGTKPSIDFINKILTEAYESGLPYDLSDMKKDIITFALKSSNQSEYCVRVVQTMPFVSEEPMEQHNGDAEEERPLVFFDIEVYPNLLLVCWKSSDSPAYPVEPGEFPVHDDRVVKMVNPTATEVEQLMQQRLVGYNCRRYDNHILYARYLGWSIEEIYQLSQKLITEKDRTAYFGEAYNLSYADIFDFASVKQGLKKWQIQLGLPHVEMDIPWDQPVPDERMQDVILYCENDVLSTQCVFEARMGDFDARKILSELSGLSVNETTQRHTAGIVFQGDKRHKDSFVYTDLSETFPGYNFDGRESTYRGEVTGEGGYVYSEPGVYNNVVVLDVASMHPTSMVELNLFGKYTEKFDELMQARLAIKRGDLDKAKEMLDGKLVPHLEGDLEALAYALKIVINSVYGLTSAHFENPFRDFRNKDNIVAKRGALFMVELKHYLQELGVPVIHIKTDSVKLADPSEETIENVKAFGEKYGYTFEVEDQYERFALVNDAVYIAYDGDKWTAVGAQFQHAYVLKILFTHEEITFDDYCETRQVREGSMYLADEGVEDVNDMQFVGRVEKFVPVLEEGQKLWRIKDDRKYAVTGTKDHLWVRASVARRLYEEGSLKLDMSYYDKLAAAAASAIAEHGDFETFINPEQGEPNG